MRGKAGATVLESKEHRENASERAKLNHIQFKWIFIIFFCLRGLYIFSVNIERQVSLAQQIHWSSFALVFFPDDS